MDIDLLLSQGLAIFLVVGGGGFTAMQLWPYVRERDIEQRERGHALALSRQTCEMQMADSLVRIAKRLDAGIEVTHITHE